MKREYLGEAQDSDQQGCCQWKVDTRETPCETVARGSDEHVTSEADRRLLTERQCVGEYNIPGSTWRRWRQDGQGPPFVRLTSRSVRYRVCDVEAWLDDRTVGSTDGGAEDLEVDAVESARVTA
jgi:predicted DNA-binding transcriptional regulator AlpA